MLLLMPCVMSYRAYYRYLLCILEIIGIVTNQKVKNCSVFSGVSSSYSPKFTETFPFLIILHTYPAFVKYALSHLASMMLLDFIILESIEKKRNND